MINSSALNREAEARPRTQRSSRKRKQTPAHCEKTILQEGLNVSALEQLSRCRVAGTWQPNGSGPTLRKIIADFLAQVCEGSLSSIWREEDRMQILGFEGRRYSGYISTQGEEIPLFEQFITNGVNRATVGKSLFSLPGWLRDIARCGLRDCFVIDMTNAHPTIQQKRHPHLCGVKEYVENREKVLHGIPTNRDVAKNLFIRLVYDGSTERWCEENDVELSALPPIVEQFRNDQREVRRLDENLNPELLSKLRAEDPARASELLQYVLNTCEERRVIDSVAQAVVRVGGEIMAYEHDGLYVKVDCRVEELQNMAAAATGYPFSVKACAAYSWDSLFQVVKERAVSCLQEDWDAVDEQWDKMEALVHKASTAKLQHHNLFATVIMSEPFVDATTAPWPLSHLFRLPVNAVNYVWYDVDRHVWVEGGANGVWRLKEYITQMLQRRLSEYELSDHLDAKVRVRFEFGNKQFRDGVESCLRSKLIADDTFHLDPESSLRYLNFDGQAWDREIEGWVRTRPDMLISRSVGWAFEECENPATEIVDKALAKIRESQDSRGLHLPSHVPEEASKLFEEAAERFPEFKFWFDFTQEWEGVIYELTHLARGLFGVLMAEALYVRGSGRNGKDTVCNAMACVGGTYVASICCSSLCSITDPDSPSPTFASVRGRRVVCIREVPKDAKIMPDVYKRFTDPFSELGGRNLYEHMVKFRPQYLAFFASNGPIPIAMDNAVRDRTAIVDHVTVFKDTPSESNDLQWKDMLSLLPKYRPGFFWLLRRVYHHLLKGRSRRNVGPIPAGSLEQKALDCADANGVGFEKLLTQLSAVRGPAEASAKEEVDRATAALCNLSASETPLYLQGQGFSKVRRVRGFQNMYFYQYSFIVDGVKGKPQFVKLTTSG